MGSKAVAPPPTPGTARVVGTPPPIPDRNRSMVRVELDASPRTVRAPLSGRTKPLAALEEVVTRAIDFQAPQLVTIVGNQGTGKSRLINELISRVTRPGAPTACRVFHGAALRDASGAPIPLAALASLVRDRFELPPDGDDIAKLRFGHEIREVLGNEDAQEMLHVLGDLVGLEFSPTPFLRTLLDQTERRTTVARAALRHFIERDAVATPLVLVFDDMQWADAETLAVVSELAVGLSCSPVVLVAAARPQMLVHAGEWGQGAVDHERIDLRNLEADDAEVMFGHLMARCPDLPDEIVQAAVEMTGGNPAFMEQLVRLYLENGAIDTTGPHWVLDLDAALSTELPISVDEAIEGRIAALEGEERDLLEKAAVFGNVFWISAVIAMTRLEAPGDPRPPGPLELEWGEGEDVRRRISDLISILSDQDYLLRLDAEDSSIPGESEVVFKHNLERELIVRSTERSRLARHYLSAAQWLEAKTVQRSDEQLEFLANLYERGGDARRAARCYLQGGDRARTRYAPEEAQALYGKGLAMLGEADAPARMDALHNLGDVLEQVGRTEDAMVMFEQMLRLSWRYDNLAKAGAAYSRLARGQRRYGNYDLAMEALRRAHELFERSRDDRGIASTLDDMGRIHWLRGAYSQALDLHRQALTTRRALGDRRSIALSLANIGRVHHDTGNFKAAINQFREALDLRRDIGDLVGVVQSLTDLGGVYTEDGNHETALELLGASRSMAQEIGDKLALAEVLSKSGEVKAAAGRGPEGIKDLTEAKHLAAGLGDRVSLVSAHQRLAQVHLQLGNLLGAEVEAHAGVAVAEAVGLRAHIGCGYRVMGEVEAAQGRGADAEDHFRRAIDILAAVKHEVELARAFQGLATLKEHAGAAGEAQKLRARAADIFTRLRGAAATD